MHSQRLRQLKMAMDKRDKSARSTSNVNATTGRSLLRLNSTLDLRAAPVWINSVVRRPLRDLA
jgi:hypothetical protein